MCPRVLSLCSPLRSVYSDLLNLHIPYEFVKVESEVDPIRRDETEQCLAVVTLLVDVTTGSQALTMRHHITAVFINLRKSTFLNSPIKAHIMVHGPVARGLGTVSCCSHKRSHTLFSLMPCQKSNDIKARIPFLYFREGYKVKDICRILGLGKTLVYECIQNYMQHQVAHRLHYCHGFDGKVPDSAVMTTRAGSILVVDYS
jgi:hypothetical protein